MVKFEFVYSLDDMKAFFKDYSAKKLLTTLTFVYIIVGAVLFFAAKQFSHLFHDNFMTKFFPVFILVVMVIIIVYSGAKAFKETPQKMFNSFNSLYSGETALFEFSENTIKHSIGSGETRSETVIEYSKLSKAIESEYYFYIFTAVNVAYVVRKSAITQGTPDELRDILQKCLGDKFTVKRKAM